MNPQTRILPLALAMLLGFPGLAAAQTIATDTTWGLGDSPVVITQSATVLPGVSLTIEAGVTVVLSADASLLVQGQLVARGTAAAPILFTSDGTGEEPIPWASVVFTSTSTPAVYEDLDDYVSGSIVEHCTFEYASRAIVLRAASPHVASCLFQNNHYDSNEDPVGGAAMVIGADSAPRVVGNTFTGNTVSSPAWGGAIHIADATPILQDNVFTENESVYGGALASERYMGAMVGNTFTGNTGSFEGGGMSLYASSPVLLNNLVNENTTMLEGAGIHVCVDCFPHANPLMADNTIIDNSSVIDGAGGVGAAFIRLFVDNNIHGNLTANAPADFGWFNEIRNPYPSWVQHPTIAGNWWGTTDLAAINDAIEDGTDDELHGLVTWEPIRQTPVEAAIPRALISTRKIRYVDAGDPMPTLLTIYNPGAAREFRLLILLKIDDLPPVPYQGPVAVPGAVLGDDGYLISMPENSVHQQTLTAPPFEKDSGFVKGTWLAALYDDQTEERLGVVCPAHFLLGLEVLE